MEKKKKTISGEAFLSGEDSGTSSSIFTSQNRRAQLHREEIARISQPKKKISNKKIDQKMLHNTRPMAGLLVFTGLNAVLPTTISPVYDFLCFHPYWERWGTWTTRMPGSFSEGSMINRKVIGLGCQATWINVVFEFIFVILMMSTVIRGCKELKPIASEGPFEEYIREKAAEIF